MPAQVQQPLMRNMIGSLTAGVLAGYFSHEPHNLSALKLMNPSMSYMEHFKAYSKSNEERLPKGWSQGAKQTGARVMGILAPKAVGTRTIQIVGTFIFLNFIYRVKHLSFGHRSLWVVLVCDHWHACLVSRRLG